MKRLSRSLALLGLAVAATHVRASNVVYSENFDVDDTANWAFTPSSATTGDGPNDNIGSDANFHFDYSTVGIPSAPGSTAGSTTGMKFVANLPGTGIFSGVTLSPNGQSFNFAANDYKISGQVWLNYYGGTTSGTTEEVMMGVGAAPGSDQFVGDNLTSVQFAASTDGDTASDYRAYKTPWPLEGPTESAPGTPAVGRVQQGESGVYASDPTGSVAGAGSGGDLDSANAYYSTLFPAGTAPPAAQQALFPNQVGVTTAAGVTAFAWHTWSIQTTHGGGAITFSIDGNAIATIQGGTINPYTLSGNDFYVGMYDINSSSPPGDAQYNAAQLLFGLVDNLSVADLTLPGDANYDGKINADDYALIDRGFGKQLATPGWSDGDFNGDGVVNAADYMIIDTQLGLQGGFTPSFLAERESEFGDAYVTSLLAAVPEPASLGLLAAPLLLAARRRRIS
ncbi:MAG TPA: dockerin type I repeat-containing protein [Tepidisphaeraceae bacterium]|jgi:hypothetical protein|nr:dockerin type I repeat-containing protein [Tepidisphaeraceae bacterium]